MDAKYIQELLECEGWKKVEKIIERKRNDLISQPDRLTENFYTHKALIDLKNELLNELNKPNPTE